MRPTPNAAAFDQEAAVEFRGRVAEILNGGAISIAISLGHVTKLFDVMAGIEAPATSADIAARAGLDERYVREWLGVMTTARIVRYNGGNSGGGPGPERQRQPDPCCGDHSHGGAESPVAAAADGKYLLPAEHAACLTRAAAAAGGTNLAVYGQFISMMGGIHPKIAENFRTGAGTSYSDYVDFHAIMSEDSDQTVVAHLFDAVLPAAPGMITRLQSDAGIDVLDAGCSRGKAVLAMAARFPKSRFVGLDLCADAIADAATAAAAAGLSNVEFAVRDLSTYNERERFDLIMSFDAVHDQKDPQDLLRRLHAALRTGGMYLMIEVGGSSRVEKNLDYPFAPFLYTVSMCHCMAVSLGQGGNGLGAMWGRETARAMLAKAGFRGKAERDNPSPDAHASKDAAITEHRFPHDPTNVCFVAVKH